MKSECKHCGSHFTPGATGEIFCCAGCERVYALIEDQGLTGYYEQKDRVGRPLEKSPFLKTDLSWAEGLQVSLEKGQARPEVKLRLSGMSCLGCVWLVERLVRRSSGIQSVHVSLEQNTLQIRWATGLFDLKRVLTELEQFGYHAKLTRGGKTGRYSASTWTMFLSVIFALNGLILSLPQILEVEGFIYEKLFFLLFAVCSVLTLAIGGSQIIVPSLKALRRGELHFDLFQLFGFGAVCVALCYQAFKKGPVVAGLWEIPLLMAAMVCVRWLQDIFWRRSALDRVLKNSKVDSSKGSGYGARMGRSLPLSAEAFMMLFWGAVILARDLEFVPACKAFAACVFASSSYPLILIARPGVSNLQVILRLLLAGLGGLAAYFFSWSLFAALAFALLAGLCFIGILQRCFVHPGSEAP